MSNEIENITSTSETSPEKWVNLEDIQHGNDSVAIPNYGTININYLIDKGFVYRAHKGRLTPKAGKTEGLSEVKETMNDKTGWAGVQTLITPKGRETFRLLTQGLR